MLHIRKTSSLQSQLVVSMMKVKEENLKTSLKTCMIRYTISSKKIVLAKKAARFTMILLTGVKCQNALRNWTLPGLMQYSMRDVN